MMKTIRAWAAGIFIFLTGAASAADVQHDGQRGALNANAPFLLLAAGRSPGGACTTEQCCHDRMQRCFDSGRGPECSDEYERCVRNLR